MTPAPTEEYELVVEFDIHTWVTVPVPRSLVTENTTQDGSDIDWDVIFSEMSDAIHDAHIEGFGCDADAMDYYGRLRRKDQDT